MLFFLVALYYFIATALSFVYSFLLSGKDIKYPIMFSGLSSLWQVLLSFIFIFIKKRYYPKENNGPVQESIPFRTGNQGSDNIDNKFQKRDNPPRNSNYSESEPRSSDDTDIILQEQNESLGKVISFETEARSTNNINIISQFHKDIPGNDRKNEKESLKNKQNHENDRILDSEASQEGEEAANSNPNSKKHVDFEGSSEPILNLTIENQRPLTDEHSNERQIDLNSNILIDNFHLNYDTLKNIYDRQICFILSELSGPATILFYEKEETNRKIVNRPSKTLERSSEISEIIASPPIVLNDSPPPINRPENNQTESILITHLLPCTLTGTLDTILSTICLQNMSLALYTMIKSSSPIFILFSSFLINNEPVSFKSFFIIMIIGTGTFFLTYKKCNSYDIYSFLTLVSTAISGVRWSFIQKYLRRERSHLKFIRNVNLIIALKLIIYSLIFEMDFHNFSRSDASSTNMTAKNLKSEIVGAIDQTSNKLLEEELKNLKSGYVTEYHEKQGPSKENKLLENVEGISDMRLRTKQSPLGYEKPKNRSHHGSKSLYDKTISKKFEFIKPNETEDQKQQKHNIGDQQQSDSHFKDKNESKPDLQLIRKYESQNTAQSKPGNKSEFLYEYKGKYNILNGIQESKTLLTPQDISETQKTTEYHEIEELQRQIANEDNGMNQIKNDAESNIEVNLLRPSGPHYDFAVSAQASNHKTDPQQDNNSENSFHNVLQHKLDTACQKTPGPENIPIDETTTHELAESTANLPLVSIVKKPINNNTRTLPENVHDIFDPMETNAINENQTTNIFHLPIFMEKIAPHHMTKSIISDSGNRVSLNRNFLVDFPNHCLVNDIDYGKIYSDEHDKGYLRKNRRNTSFFKAVDHHHNQKNRLSLDDKSFKNRSTPSIYATSLRDSAPILKLCSIWNSISSSTIRFFSRLNRISIFDFVLWMMSTLISSLSAFFDLLIQLMPFIVLIVVLSSFSFLLIIVEFSILNKYSSVFLSILGIFKELTIIILSTYLFKTITLTGVNWVGLIISLIGLFVYAIFKGSK